MVAAALLALAVQVSLPDSVAVTGEPSPYAIFGARHLRLMHLVPFDTAARHVAPGEPIGKIEDHPARFSLRHHATILKARELYARRQFAEAAALLARAYVDEPDNPFVADEYARTLFWIDDRRDESFRVYRKLIEQLDRRHGTSDSVVAVDAWFAESYWKVASLYLDRGEWEPAAFEITRYLAIRGLGPDEQVFTYLAEAYVHLGRTEFARWSAGQALRVNPRSDALQYLYQLGPAARQWGPTHVFACREVTDSLPCYGAYSFRRDASGAVTCVAPREEPPTPLSPCLRLGWVHVGQTRGDVEQILGRPWQPSPPRADGTEGFAYLVFTDSVRDRGAYYVVEYERAGGGQIARSIQFTGDSIPLPLDFSGLRIGDLPDRVLRQLGAPTSRGEFNDEAQGIRGEWWDWTRASISLEIVNGRLYSVRLWRPDGVRPAAIQRDFSRFR
ncbi:MAG TPA: hypothetical protein VGQ06_03130 [Gemmatimonadales bacterium]|jgi:hypothetical protein|nr:hypothetical protein [Gemmatimonadales bacterium]